MIIISNEDPVYVSWLQRHRDGYVLDTRRNPTARNTVLHRATCAEIKTAKSKRTHWTTGRKTKACSLDIEELAAWAREQTGRDPRTCEACQPLRESIAEEDGRKLAGQSDYHLTGLGRDLVSCVVEVAVIHLDDHTDYELTMGYIANYLTKSPAQLTAAVLRLVHDGLLTMDREVKPGEPIPDSCRIFPTPEALRTLPAFRELSNAALSAELDSLHRH